MSEAAAPNLVNIKTIRAIFSDVDGTIVHYEKSMQKQGYELETTDEKITASRCGVPVQRVCWVHQPTQTKVWCLKVPSLTLGGGYMSEETLRLIDELREQHGVAFVVMTGARTSTMLLRRKSATLPTSDFDICEGGGKIWEREGRLPLEDAPLDEEWTKQFVAVAGPTEQLDSDPNTRLGPLWDVYRILKQEGFHLDAASFSTSFLVDLSKSVCVVSGKRTLADTEEYLKAKFATELSPKFQVTYITNLGKGQVCPVGCNKKTAMMYVAKKLKLLPDESSSLLPAVALFDDENDLEFASSCVAGFIPSVAHDSVLTALQETDGDHNKAKRWLRTPIEGPLGTDYALREVLAFVRLHSNKASL